MYKKRYIDDCVSVARHKRKSDGERGVHEGRQKKTKNFSYFNNKPK